MPTPSTTPTSDCPTTASFPQPYAIRPEPAAYHGLLTDPVGRYGRVPYGACVAVTLRGCPTFLRRAENLFSSYGGDSYHPDGRGGWRREMREPVFHDGDDPGTRFFCLPEGRVKAALRIWLYGQLCRTKAIRDYIRDAEGDVLETIYLNETALMVEAAQLAESFWAYEMRPDYAVLADRCLPESHHQVLEYAVLQPQCVDDNDEAAVVWDVKPSIGS
jgi:hypothetical protein